MATTTKKYLDNTGLVTLWNKVKAKAAEEATAKASAAQQAAIAAAATDAAAKVKAVTDTKGAAGGIATLDEQGKIPTSQLPSYVSDVIEGNNKQAFPATGEANKIYVDKSDGKTYRWSGTAYVEISASIALGETSATAYAGNKGKQNADNIATLQSDMAAAKSKLAGIEAQANKTVINNTLVSNSTTEALSAAQGKALKTAVDAAQSAADGAQTAAEGAQSTADGAQTAAATAPTAAEAAQAAAAAAQATADAAAASAGAMEAITDAEINALN